jgi:hypothetical protein
MHFVATTRQLLAQGGGEDAAPAYRRVTGDADPKWASGRHGKSKTTRTPAHWRERIENERIIRKESHGMADPGA